MKSGINTTNTGILRFRGTLVTVMHLSVHYYISRRICRERHHTRADARATSTPSTYDMTNKRKADAAPTGLGAPKAGRGGGGRGAGRKRKPENEPGVDAAEAPIRKQATLGDLLGERFAKKQKRADAEQAQVGARFGRRSECLEEIVEADGNEIGELSF